MIKECQQINDGLLLKADRLRRSLEFIFFGIDPWLARRNQAGVRHHQATRS